MSDPFTERCEYCGSPNVLDDAWFCGAAECWAAYQAGALAQLAYETRLPLTRNKGRTDTGTTKACVWGHAVAAIEDAGDRLMAVVGIPLHYHQAGPRRKMREMRQEFERIDTATPFTEAR